MSAPQPEDSLDNLSSLQVNKQRQLIAQVKQQFATALQKLQFSQTRQIGIAELRKLTEHYPQPEHLRSYMATLKTLKANSNSSTKQHQILVISILAQNFRQNLLDPLDKPPSLLKSCFRLVEVLLGYFADRSPTVQRACARALLDITTHCLRNQGLDSVFQIAFSPLLSILRSGVDKGSQGTSAACLNELITYCRSVEDKETLNKLAPQLLTVFLKVNSEYHQLFHAVFSILEIQGLGFLEGRLVTFLAKILAVLAATRDSQSNNTLNSYMCKVNVCKIVEKLGFMLPIDEKQKLIDLNVLQALQQASRHRIIQVQMAANRALKAWKGQLQQTHQKGGLQSLEEKRNSKKRERSKSKEDRDRMEHELTFMKEDLEKMVKGGWGASNRAKNFVKRGSGVGGGYHGRMEHSPQSRSNSKSHKEHIQQLRQYIKKGTQVNRHLDRFAPALIQEKQRQRSNSPPSRSKQTPFKAQKNIDGDEQFGLEEDSGDQMFAPGPARFQPKSSKGHLRQVGITFSEVNELAEHEQTILEEGKNMNVKFYSQKSEKSDSIAPPLASPVLLPNDSLQQKEKIQKDVQMRIPLKANQIPTNIKANNQQLHELDYIKMSQEEIGELIQECSLSQVSDNLSGLLNESDLLALQGGNYINETVFETDQGKPGLKALRKAVAQKKAKKSLMEQMVRGSLPREEEKEQNHLDQKIIGNNDVENEEKVEGVELVLPITDMHLPIKDMHLPITNIPLPITQQAEPGISLNFTESVESAKGSQKRQDIQFTLNPKEANRFSSLKVDIPAEEKEVEEDIVMSCYEESLPKKQPQHPTPLLPPPPVVKYPQREAVSEDRNQYQNMIKNPPKNIPFPAKSRIQNKEESHLKSQIDESCSPGVGPQWLHILKMLDDGEFNAAFQAILELDDPIYLLRAMLLTKCPVKRLSAVTAQQLWSTFLKLYSHHLVDSLSVTLFEEADELKLLSRCLSVQQIQDLLLDLYEVSGVTKGKLSYRAATLYNSVEASLRPE